MPKANIPDHELRKMQLKKKAEEKKKEEKILALERAQQEAKVKKQEEPPKDDMEFLIREAKAKAEEKHIEFIPDFDVDEVPPLE
jgi:hypothetical protein